MLRGLGVKFVASGARFWTVWPLSALTPEREALVSQYRAEITALLRTEARFKGCAFCSECGAQLEFHGARVPAGQWCGPCRENYLSSSRLLALQRAAYGPAAGLACGVN